MAVITRREFEPPPWKHSLATVTFTTTDLLAVPVWSLLRGLHPFTVTVEPDAVLGFVGVLQLVVSNTPFFVPPTGTIFPTLGDPMPIDPADPTKQPGSFIYNAPFQWVGVVPTALTSGQVEVHIFASPYSRNFAP